MEKNKELQWGKIKAILFDIDGTMSDSDDQLVAKVAGWLNPLGFLLGEKKQNKFARWLVMTVESPGNFIYNLTDYLNLDGLLIKFLNQLTQAKKT